MARPAPLRWFNPRGRLRRTLRTLFLVGGALALLLTGTIELTWPQQAVLGLATVLLAGWLDRSSNGYLLTVTLMLLSLFSTFRYGFWRVSYTARFLLDPGTHWSALDGFFIALLLGAEFYACVILFLGYGQTLWPLKRLPAPLPPDPESWPAVDLLIPTYNEPLSVVRFTALAALNLDWPADKLHVYLLDDGNREEFRRFAAEAGIGYKTRTDNRHAKAGNINRALESLHSPFVAIFDSDHVPTRSFLQVTMGWFVRDRKLGLLQTPHHFYSPDPFERNLKQFRVIPNENELFYGVVQDGNDFWNATFFCGSCAVLRREALDGIGGIAVETVTEDAHTSLRLQMRGWNTAYVNIPQAAGLATERLSGHVKQRVRWARGMIQILRIDNPLLAPGLSWAQRLCYFNAMTHFLYALPRLIFLTAPLIYLVLGRTNVPGYWAAIFSYAFPHLVLSAMTNSRIQGKHRHSFWNEIYETVLAPYIFLPTMLALLNPKLGSFNVTAKGGIVRQSFFDKRIAQPFLMMIALNFLGIAMAIPRLFFLDLPGLRGLFDGEHPGTVLTNLFWVGFNLVILGVATAVAWESQQRRGAVRVEMRVPVAVTLEDGTVLGGMTADLSSTGVMLQLPGAPGAPGASGAPGAPGAVVGAVVRVGFPATGALPELPLLTLPATVVHAADGVLRAHFGQLTLAEEEVLTLALYARADTWLGFGESREVDRPLVSLGRIFQLSGIGLLQTARGLAPGAGRRRQQQRAEGKRRSLPAAGAAAALPCLGLGLALALLGLHASPAHAAQRAASIAAPIATAAPGTSSGTSPDTVTASTDPHSAPLTRPLPGTFHSRFTLAELGVRDTIVLRGVDSAHSLFFAVPQTEIVRAATLHLRFHFSPGLLPAVSHLNVSLNGALVATLPVTAAPALVRIAEETGGDRIPGLVHQTGALLEATLPLPAEMLVHANDLRFEFIGHYTTQCEDPVHSTLWSRVDTASTLELAGTLLPLGDDLSLLPLPFYGATADLHPVIPIVFFGQPSSSALQAAAIVASYFGTLANDRPVRFPVYLNTIPGGNAVVFGEHADELPTVLGLPQSAGPTLAMRTNPNDRDAKILLVAGDRGEDLVTAATVLALERNLLGGPEQRAALTHAPRPREPDDAPRWLSTDHVTHLGELTEGNDLQGDSSTPVGAFLRVPPDLFYGSVRNLSYHMSYRYNGMPLADESSLEVYANTAYISSTPMPHQSRGSAVLDTVVPVPVGDMRPFSNTLMHRFSFQIAKKGRCQDTAPTNLEGRVLKDSYLDLRGIPHSAVLPNLEIFANAGYPFTRRADLADTAVVLPDTPTAHELEVFLTLMGHFGAQTGYPVLRVLVTNAAGMAGDGRRDHLVLGTMSDQPAMARIGSALPVLFDADGLRIENTPGLLGSFEHPWWKVPSADRIEPAQIESAGTLPDALMEGLEWPARSGRSLVFLALRDDSVSDRFLESFLSASQSSDIAQSVSVLERDHFVSYRIGESSYRLGGLSVWFRLSLLVSEYPWLLVGGTLLLSLLMAFPIRMLVREHAARRLGGI